MDKCDTAKFCLERLFRAAAAYYFLQETGKMLDGRTLNSVIESEVRNELFGALVDTRLSYFGDKSFPDNEIHVFTIP